MTLLVTSVSLFSSSSASVDVRVSHVDILDSPRLLHIYIAMCTDITACSYVHVYQISLQIITCQKDNVQSTSSLMYVSYPSYTYLFFMVRLTRDII